jgi:hypothetical protein
MAFKRDGFLIIAMLVAALLGLAWAQHSSAKRDLVTTFAALLGHENRKTTAIYARPSEDELQLAMEDRIGVA